jgi:hypothetical protein
MNPELSPMRLLLVTLVRVKKVIRADEAFHGYREGSSRNLQSVGWDVPPSPLDFHRR